MRDPATSSPTARSATGRLYPPGGAKRSADRLPVDHRTDLGFFFAGGGFEVVLASGGEIDRHQLLEFFAFDQRRHRPAVGGEHRVGLRAVRQFGDLLGTAGADLLHPQAAVAAEDQRVALRRDVFDVGRADAADQRLHPPPVRFHRVDVGVARRALGLVAAAEDDPAGEVARVELVDVGGLGQAGEADAVRAYRVEVVVGTAGGGGAADEDDLRAVG